MNMLLKIFCVFFAAWTLNVSPAQAEDAETSSLDYFRQRAQGVSDAGAGLAKPDISGESTEDNPQLSFFDSRKSGAKSDTRKAKAENDNRRKSEQDSELAACAKKKTFYRKLIVGALVVTSVAALGSLYYKYVYQNAVSVLPVEPPVEDSIPVKPNLNPGKPNPNPGKPNPNPGKPGTNGLMGKALAQALAQYPELINSLGPEQLADVAKHAPQIFTQHPELGFNLVNGLPYHSLDALVGELLTM